MENLADSSPLTFRVTHRDAATHARLGVLHTPHGRVDTPAYMPVGTHGAVRCLTPQQVADTGTQMVLANTYHLHLRPGEEIVEAAGGLHRFMAWPGPILTDSGGFQVFSLSQWTRLREEGVAFRSPIDGAMIELTPERAIAIQERLGADIAMVFDHCPPFPASREEVSAAVERTTRWAERCRAVHRREDQALFGIVQGGVHLDLRERSLAALLELDFPGYAIGGVSVGESRDEVRRVVAECGPWLPAGRPRYLMGIGVPEDLLAAVAAGVDLFDCVLATRNARNGHLFSRAGTVRIRNQAHERDFEPVDPACRCYTCKHFSKSYLRHLQVRRESLAGTLGSIHNVHFLQDLMAAIRRAIAAGDFGAFLREYPDRFRSESAEEA